MVRAATAVMVIMLTTILVVSLLLQLTALYVVTARLTIFSPSSVNKMMVKCFLPNCIVDVAGYCCCLFGGLTASEQCGIKMG